MLVPSLRPDSTFSCGHSSDVSRTQNGQGLGRSGMDTEEERWG
jgi:hypothetical protein